MRNYQIPFEEYQNNPYKKGISNCFFKTNCKDCGEIFSSGEIKNFRKRSILNLEPLCRACYLQIRCYKNPEWKKNNSKSQKIAQNKPEQKLKNAIGVSRSWTKERRLKNSKFMLQRWENSSQEDKDSMLKGFLWMQQTEDGYRDFVLKSIAKKQKHGSFFDVPYESLLELGFLLECHLRNLNVERWYKPIPYVNFDNKNKLYYPDFLLEGRVIVEVKGHIFKGENGEKNFKCKTESGKRFALKNNLKYRLFFRSKFLSARRKIIKLIHENQEQASEIIQREGLRPNCI